MSQSIFLDHRDRSRVEFLKRQLTGRDPAGVGRRVEDIREGPQGTGDMARMAVMFARHSYVPGSAYKFLLYVGPSGSDEYPLEEAAYSTLRSSSVSVRWERQLLVG